MCFGGLRGRALLHVANGCRRYVALSNTSTIAHFFICVYGLDRAETLSLLDTSHGVLSFPRRATDIVYIYRIGLPASKVLACCKVLG